MKITQKVVEQIEKMQKGGFEDSEIKELLDLQGSVQQTLASFKQHQEGLLKADEVAVMLEKGLASTREKFNYDKVLRLARQGRLKVAEQHVGESGKLYKRAGVLFRKEDVQAYITNGLKTKDQLLREVDQLEKTLSSVIKERDELREQLEAQPKETEASPEFADLVSENTQLRSQMDTLKDKLDKQNTKIETLTAKLNNQSPQEEKKKKNDENEYITPEIANEICEQVILLNEQFQPIADALKRDMHHALFTTRKRVRWFNGSYYKNPLQSSNKYHFVDASGAMTSMLDELEDRIKK